MLHGSLGSIVLDYNARRKAGGTNLRYFTMRQLPIFSPETHAGETPWQSGIPLRDWLFPRVLELTETAWHLQPFADDCGWTGPSFHWEAARRLLPRCELDAAFFHLYRGGGRERGAWNRDDGAARAPLIPPGYSLLAFSPAPRDAVAYIMDTTPLVRRKDEARQGDYRTRGVLLAIYDAMHETIGTGYPCQAGLDPPPADPSCCYPSRHGRQPGA